MDWDYRGYGDCVKMTYGISHSFLLLRFNYQGLCCPSTVYMDILEVTLALRTSYVASTLPWPHINCLLRQAICIR